MTTAILALLTLLVTLSMGSHSVASNRLPNTATRHQNPQGTYSGLSHDLTSFRTVCFGVAQADHDKAYHSAYEASTYQSITTTAHRNAPKGH
jgi:hypothetical protein